MAVRPEMAPGGIAVVETAGRPDLLHVPGKFACQGASARLNYSRRSLKVLLANHELELPVGCC